ncbi:MAG: AbrB/MazE/SpoVT family DNA-binding domain-containing protein [Actinomycetota bacterium]
MRVRMDKAGRLVIPKSLRDLVGLVAGEVEILREGAGIRIVPVASDSLVGRAERSVLPPAGSPIDDEFVQRLRDFDQR